MKTINILYWTSTILLVALMISTIIPEIINGPEAIKFTAHMGYPPYLNPYLGVLKILGIIALLVPGFPRITEWAYAGFTFDLLGATYSFIAMGEPVKSWGLMLIFIAILACSYICYHKRLEARTMKNAG